MTAIAIIPESLPDGPSFRAVAGQRQSVGRTPGEALDSIARQLTDGRRIWHVDRGSAHARR